MFKPIFSLLSSKSKKGETKATEKNDLSWLDPYGKGPYIPKISIDSDRKKVYMLGAAYMENSAVFFDELINFLSKSLKKEDWQSLHLSLDYFNSGSSKGLLKLFFTCKEWSKEYPDISVHWHFDSLDSDLKEEIQDFTDDTGLPIIMDENGYLTKDDLPQN
ncbi:SiaC family regulatory phosphoprotein [Sediminitomix flava]|uniref:Uncharacterized protein DUF1987 n=1 Tax=Sediminitomix flava TaxID=379075 RepID=A0A315Z4T1_SEDFL|nr:SiaC family regulatory phosphoprotein [Sediminitomix flava]PWJ38488.1 uncharacterized protein DUF1987 [Sediminitomix flava]